jgi:hypothetical protein
MKIRFYLHSTLWSDFTQMALWPAMYVTHNKITKNIRYPNNPDDARFTPDNF